MSQISSYKAKNKPVGSDLLIGTSSINGQTRNFSVDALTEEERNARIQADSNLQSQIDAISLDTVTTIGSTTTNNISVGNTTATSFTKVGGVANEFLKADGSVDSTDYTTSSELSSETTARQGADTTLQTNIDNEEAARVLEDANLQGQIDTVSTNLSTEITARTNSDNTLQSNIDTEETARIAGDADLQDNIDTLEDYVDNNFELQANKNVANGYAPLDSSAKYQ